MELKYITILNFMTFLNIENMKICSVEISFKYRNPFDKTLKLENGYIKNIFSLFSTDMSSSEKTL